MHGLNLLVDGYDGVEHREVDLPELNPQTGQPTGKTIHAHELLVADQGSSIVLRMSETGWQHFVGVVNGRTVQPAPSLIVPAMR